MFIVGDLVTLEEKMCTIFGLEDTTLIGVVVGILRPIPNHIINRAYLVHWMNETYPPGVLPPNVAHGFADIEHDIIFYEHELLLLKDLIQREKKIKNGKEETSKAKI